MAKMVPYDAFAYPCGVGDLVLRESYKPKTCGKLYYACPRSKPRENTFGCKFFCGRRNESVYWLVLLELQRLQFILQDLHRLQFILQDLQHLHAILQALQHLKAILEATVDMYMHSEQHTVNSAALFHEVYNNMGKLDLE
ncbi:hypothetical protein Tco_0004801 [Tanacetum coccineum]